MPTYEYVCKACGEHLEAVQSFHDPALTTCPACGGALRKVFGNVGIVFKGSGFYKTDSRGSTGSSGAGSGSGTTADGPTESSSSPSAPDGPSPAGATPTPAPAAGTSSSTSSNGGGSSGTGSTSTPGKSGASGPSSKVPASG